MTLYNQAIQENGLLAEFAYLKLEDDRFDGSINNNDDIKYFLDTVKLNTGETYKDATGIDINRVDEIKSLLNQYEVVKFISDDGWSGSVYYPSAPHYTPTPPTPVVKCVNHPNYNSAERMVA